jgi:nitrite reductase/ring-hydroxylating ferredoxin subunit
MTGVLDGFVRAAALDDVAPGALTGVRVAGRAVCLARAGDELFAFPDECTHRQFPLSRGDLRPDGTIVCAWHGAAFDCRTGAVREGPATAGLRPYDVITRDGDVYVRPCH